MGITFNMLSIAMLISAGVTFVRAESHTIRFKNQCGMGTPQLVIGGKVLSNGEDWTSNGPAQSGIAYLQTGPCLLNGENCALVEYNLNNPACPGCGSSADISLIDPHRLNVPLAISYFNGRDGQGAICTTPDCDTAFHNPNDNQVQIACQEDNVNLLITFCPNNTSVAPAPAQNPPQSSKVEPAAIASPTSHSPSHSLSLHPYASKLSTSIASPAKSEVVSYPTPPPPLPSTFHKSSAVSAPKPSTLVNVGKGAGKPAGKTCTRRPGRGHRKHGHTLPHTRT